MCGKIKAQNKSRVEQDSKPWPQRYCGSALLTELPSQLGRYCSFIFSLFPYSRLYLLNGFDLCFYLFWMAWHWKPAIELPSQLVSWSCWFPVRNIPVNGGGTDSNEYMKDHIYLNCWARGKDMTGKYLARRTDREPNTFPSGQTRKCHGKK